MLEVLDLSGREIHLNLQIDTFSYGKNRVIENFQELIFRGEKVGFIGRNGIGKSTILNLIAKKYKLSSGKIENTFPDDVTYITESLCFFEHLTFKENLDYFQSSFKATSDARERVELYFGADIPENVISKNLSTGQKRRLMLSIGLLSKTALYLLDEPTNGLDVTSKHNLTEYFCEELQEETVLLVSHDFDFVKSICTRVLFLVNADEVIHLDLTEENAEELLEKMYYEYVEK